MVRSLAALAALATLALTVATASAKVEDNYWKGPWQSKHKGTHLMMLYLRQAPNDEDVWGTYRHPHDNGNDRGRINAEAKGDFGKTLVGTYTSVNGGGSGHFKLFMNDNLNSWYGKFWPCSYFCSSIKWTGHSPGFGD